MAVDNTHFKGCWRPEEDEALRKAVSLHGEKNWSTVARTFNTLMGRSPLVGRAPKQCRSRYLQQLVPGIKTGEWSVEEEEILVEGHRQFGNQWTLIASMLPGRTETSVKNHYNCTARRKVPSDLSRMTVLQRYLASIGVISLSPGAKNSAAKYPSLGSGYPNSNSSMYFHNTAAAAAAAGGSSSRKRGTSAPADGHSPTGSHQPYDEYDSGQLAQAYSEADYSQAYAAYQAYGMEPHQMAAAAAAAAAMQQQQQAYEDEGVEEDATAGAADGLLKLAHAAMLHLEELDAEGDEAAGSGSGEQQCIKDEYMDEAAGDDVEDDDHHHHQQQQRQQHQGIKQELQQQPHHLEEQQQHSSKGAAVSPAAAAAARSPASRCLAGWLKPESLALSVMSSEESDRTAEEPEEGSPLAEQLLRQQLKRGSPSSGNNPSRLSSMAAAGAAPSKRSRSIWAGSEAAAAAAAAQAGIAGVGPAVSRPGRPVLDVSEPEGTTVPPALSIPTTPASPAVPSVASNTNSMTDMNAQFLAMIMGAFMGAAAESSAAASPAAALPPSTLAAIARVMAMSGLAVTGQQAAAADADVGAETDAGAGCAEQQQVPAGISAAAAAVVPADL